MTDDRQLEALLREGMAAEVRPVVAESRLTEQIIAAAGQDESPRISSSWQNWVLPAVAAVLVALLVGSVLFGARLLHSAGQSPAGHRTPEPSTPVSIVPNPSPSVKSSPSAPASQGGTSVSAQPGTGPVPTGFVGYDLTWVSQDEGWALGTAPCSTAPCTSIVHTLDGGQSWGGLPAPKAYLADVDTCSSSCDRVSGIRFADAQHGYVYGPNSFFTTDDGGRNWTRQNGNAWALEPVAGQVLRVSGADPNCAPGCRFRLQRAAVGSTDWKAVSLPGATQDVRATLSANGDDVVLGTYGNPAGGASDEQSIVFRSGDGGLSWQRIGEPCPQSGGEVDSTALTVAGDGSISAVCTIRGRSTSFVVTAGAGSGSFTSLPDVPGGSAGPIAAVSAGDVLVGTDRLYRWDGSSWRAVAGPGRPGFIGFESGQVGRLVADNGVWMTIDGGRSWNQLSY